MLRKFAIALGAPVILAVTWSAAGAASIEPLNDPTYASRSVRHTDRTHTGAASRSGAGLRSWSAGTGSTGLSYRSGSSSVGSGWHQPGFGGTSNPGWGYNFGPQLGGIGR
jgi:hypothetical protein